MLNLKHSANMVASRDANHGLKEIVSAGPLIRHRILAFISHQPTFQTSTSFAGHVLESLHPQPGRGIFTIRT
jgi:hypothetical protein